MATEIKRTVHECGQVLMLAIEADVNHDSRFSYAVAITILWLIGRIGSDTLKAQLDPSREN